MLAPILAYTADEIWNYLPHLDGQNPAHAVFNEIPRSALIVENSALKADWEQLERVREDVKKALELARTDKVIGASLEAKLTIYADGETYALLNRLAEMLPSVFIVSEVTLQQGGSGAYAGEHVSVTVAHADGEKCERCWSYRADVGVDAAHPTLCGRCASILKD